MEKERDLARARRVARKWKKRVLHQTIADSKNRTIPVGSSASATTDHMRPSPFDAKVFAILMAAEKLAIKKKVKFIQSGANTKGASLRGSTESSLGTSPAIIKDVVKSSLSGAEMERDAASASGAGTKRRVRRKRGREHRRWESKK